jgi:ABC-type phosphate transport system ATPase subunit
MSITGVSISVSGIATLLATLTAITLAFAIFFLQIQGKQALITLVNTGLGRALADRAGILLNGELIEVSTKEQIFTHLNDARSYAFINGEFIY